MRLISLYLIGLLFGVGISISGMANPAKVLNFFDVAGSWDPSLAFVMGGALLVAAVGYRVAFRKPAPSFAPEFDLPSANRIDPQLIAGAGIFGVGWGVAGFCPGGALPALGTGRAEVAWFVLALIAGILITRFILARQTKPHKSPA